MPLVDRREKPFLSRFRGLFGRRASPVEKPQDKKEDPPRVDYSGTIHELMVGLSIFVKDPKIKEFGPFPHKKWLRSAAQYYSVNQSLTPKQEKYVRRALKQYDAIVRTNEELPEEFLTVLSDIYPTNSGLQL